MLKFKPLTEERSDCTKTYSVTSDTHLTVAEFIKEVLKCREWGYLKFYYTLQTETNWDDIVVGAEYKLDNLIYYNEKFQNIQNDIISKITAYGGWTRMDYDVFIKKGD